jgi:hypothetical protein
MGNAAAPAGAVEPFYGPTGRQEQRAPLPNPPGQQDLSGTAGRPGAADTAAVSAEAAVRYEGLLAGRNSGWTKLEYTAARPRDPLGASVKCTGL